MSVYNSAATLGEQLAALADQTYEGAWELLIDDNGSTDESIAIARRWLGALPHLRVIDASERRGDPGARNLGALHARGEILAFCDSDDIVDRDWLRWIVAGMGDHDMVVGACQLRNDAELSGPGAPSGARMLGHEGGYGYLPYGVSANMAVSADAYRRLGGFREDYPVGYDIDLCWRLQQTGLRFGLAPKAVVYKRARGTTRGAWRQHFVYGQGDVVLFRRFRRQGMPRNVRLAIRVYGWLAVNALRLHQPDVRFVWVRSCGKCCGRVVGSLRERTLYP